MERPPENGRQRGSTGAVRALALLWTYAHEPEGLLSIPCFGGWLVVTGESQAMTGLVLARAVGAVSCLYFLSLTTPVPEVLSVLRRLRMPGVLLDLAILIYRYIFILQTACREMRDAAAAAGRSACFHVPSRPALWSCGSSRD